MVATTKPKTKLAVIQMDCIFCSIVQKTSPAHILWEDDHHMAFLSIFPNTPGFSVVIPKQHYGSYAFAQSDSVLADLAVAAKKTALQIDRAFPDVARTGMFLAENPAITGVSLSVDNGQHLVPLERDVMFMVKTDS